MYPTIVITSAVAWSGLTARPQHIARQLAKRGWPVLFVEPPVTLLGPLRNKALRHQMLPKLPVDQLSDEHKIRVLHPVTTLPLYNAVRPINRWNQRLLAGQIREQVPNDLILLANLPSSVDLIPYLGPVATFYDCVDDHAAFGGLSRLDVIESMERSLAYQSRAIFATADALVEKMEQYHSDVRLLPNAVELSHFTAANTANVHPELLDIAGPRVGFIGGMGSWLDYSFIRQLAMQKPDVQFVFVGPVEADVTPIRSLPNVHILGRRPYADMPRFLAGFDICLYPFADNKLTESVNPVKVYEYLAAGREVIATPTREIHKFAKHVWLTHDVATGAQAIDAILAGERRNCEPDRTEFLAAQTWDARVDELEAVLQNHLPQQR